MSGEEAGESGLKVCVIGAGSTYTPELIEGLIDRAGSLVVREIAMVDIDPERLGVLAAMARRMLAAGGADIAVTTHTERTAGISGADFVLNQIRVGGQAARIGDERLGRSHDVVGQETTGPGGFAKALRTIPVALGIAADIRAESPKAWMINFTNPAGMVTEALLRFGKVRVMGLCNSPFGMQAQIARSLGVEPRRIRLDVVGLNHLSWVRGVALDGQDVFDRILEGLSSAEQRGYSGFDADLIATLRMIPSGYLQYFYAEPDVLAQQREGGPTRGEEVWALERDLLEQYRDEGLCCKPPLLARRGGAHYSTLAVSLVDSIANDRADLHIVDCRNAGTLPDLPDEVAIEMPAVIDGRGAHPLCAGHLPPEIRGLVQHVKAYEELTIEAALSGDSRTALLALMTNPLVPSYATARALWEDIKDQNQEFLPQFSA